MRIYFFLSPSLEKYERHASCKQYVRIYRFSKLPVSPRRRPAAATVTSYRSADHDYREPEVVEYSPDLEFKVSFKKIFFPTFESKAILKLFAEHFVTFMKQ